MMRTSTWCRDFVVALSKAQAIDSEQGDIYGPVQNGVITWEKVVEIADVLCRESQGQATNDDEIILLNVQGGQGIVDIALAEKWHESAKQHGAKVTRCVLRRARIGGRRVVGRRRGKRSPSFEFRLSS